jgi:pentatricopeptide repeat protein
LLESQFSDWPSVLVAQGRSASLDTLLLDWLSRLEESSDRESSHALQVDLFSDLCLRLVGDSPSPSFGLRAVQQGLLAWTRVAAYHPDALLNARELFEAFSFDWQSGASTLKARLEQRQSMYRSFFLVASRTVHHPEAAVHATWLLDQIMAEESEQQLPVHSLVSQEAFHWTLRAAAQQADEGLFDEVGGRMHAYGYTSTAVSYDCRMQLYQSQCALGQDRLGQARRLWENLLQMCRQEESTATPLIPLAATLGRLLLMFQQNHQLDTTLQLLREAMDLTKEVPHCADVVDAHVMRAVMTTLVRHDRLPEADRLFQYMVTEYNQGTTVLQPTLEHFSLLIRGYAMAGSFGRALELLQIAETVEDVEWTVEPYHALMSGLLKFERYPLSPVEQLFKRMQNDRGLSPTIVSYTKLMQACIKSKPPNYWERVDQLFQHVQSSFPDISNSGVYAVAMNAWAGSRSNQAVSRCEDIFKQTPQVEEVHYNTMLKAYAFSHQPEKAEHLLRQMMVSRVITPNLTSFNTAILAWGMVSNSERALALLELMATDGLEKAGVTPDRTTIHTVLRSSTLTLKTTKAIMKLLRRTGLEQEPELVLPVMRAVLQADNVKDASRAWAFAQECLQTLGTSAPSKVYVRTMKAGARLFVRSDERDAELGELFKACAEAGRMDQSVLQAFHRHLSPGAFLKLTLQDPRRQPHLELIPEAWKRHVIVRQS